VATSDSTPPGFGQGEPAQPTEHMVQPFIAALLQFEAEHAAEAPLLASGQVVLRVAGQARVVDLAHGGWASRNSASCWAVASCWRMRRGSVFRPRSTRKQSWGDWEVPSRLFTLWICWVSTARPGPDTTAPPTTSLWPFRYSSWSG